MGKHLRWDLTPMQWTAIAGFLTSTATQIATLGDSWAHAVSPAFVSLLLAQTGSFLMALFAQPKREQWTPAKRERRRGWERSWREYQQERGQDPPLPRS